MASIDEFSLLPDQELHLAVLQIPINKVEGLSLAGM